MIRKQMIPILAVALLVLIAGASRHADAQTAKESKSEKLLKEIKAIYKPLPTKNSFIVSYKGNEIKEIGVITVEVGQAISAGADIIAGRDIDLTPEVMRKLLEFNSRADFIKVGISDIGSIRVQSEHEFTGMSTKFFEELLNQVASGADEVAAIIRPVRKKTSAR